MWDSGGKQAIGVEVLPWKQKPYCVICYCANTFFCTGQWDLKGLAHSFLQIYAALAITLSIDLKKNKKKNMLTILKQIVSYLILKKPFFYYLFISVTQTLRAECH